MSQRTPVRHSSGRASSPRVRGGASGILAAASLWGTAGAAQAYADGSSPFSIAAIRIVIGGLALLAFAAATRRAALRRLAAGRGGLAIIAAGAIAIAVYQVAFFAAADRTGVAVGTVVTIGSAPVFTGLIGLLVRRAGLSARWALATAGAVAGCALLVGGGSGEAGAEPVGVAFALLAGLSYGVYATAASVLITRGEDGRAVVAALFGAAAVPMLPVLLSWPTAWLATGPGALIALYLGVVTTGGGYLLFARGLRTTPATTATTLTLAEPGVAAVLGTVLLGESLGAVAAAGLALLGAGLVVLVVPITPNKLGRTRRKFRTAR